MSVGLYLQFKSDLCFSAVTAPLKTTKTNTYESCLEVAICVDSVSLVDYCNARITLLKNQSLKKKPLVSGALFLVAQLYLFAFLIQEFKFNNGHGSIFNHIYPALVFEIPLESLRNNPFGKESVQVWMYRQHKVSFVLFHQKVFNIFFDEI